MFPCRQRQARLSVNALGLFPSELSSETVCDPADVAHNGQVAFVAMEHPLKQPQVSSLISPTAPTAEQTPTATAWIQIICPYLPLRVASNMIGQTGWSILSLLWGGSRYVSNKQNKHGIHIGRWDMRRSLSHCPWSVLEQMMVQCAGWEEVKKKSWIPGSV